MTGRHQLDPAGASSRLLRKKGPVRAYSAAIFVRLGDIVGRDRDEPAIANLHLTMELQQASGLTAILRTEAAAAKYHHHRILSL